MFLSKRQNKLGIINVTAYILNIITTVKSIIIPSNQQRYFFCRSPLVPDIRNKLQIRFKIGIIDKDTVKYGLGEFLWQSDNTDDSNSNKYFITKIDALKLIYKKDNLMILDCKLENSNEIFCMKIRTPFADHEIESEKYIEMSKSPSIKKCFPKVFGMIRFQMGDGQFWGGICMEKMSHTLVSLMYTNEKLKLETSLEDLNSRFLSENTITLRKTEKEIVDDKNLGGVLVKRRCESETFQTCLIAASIRLLTKLHKEGWVHGDTHLGNFVLNQKNWRIYAIDIERSFKSIDPIQHFLDIQELFGHAIGLIISKSNSSIWDFGDIIGVACKLHPKLSNSNTLKTTPSMTSAFSMLPVCSCFSNTTPQERIKGCFYCQSNPNKLTAFHFKNNSEEYIKSFMNMSINMIKHCTKIVRERSNSQFVKVVHCLLSPKCSQDLSPLILEKEGIHMDKISTDEITQANFELWVENLLYGGAFDNSKKITTGMWLSILKFQGHHAAAAAILECCYKHIYSNNNDNACSNEIPKAIEENQSLLIDYC